MTGFGKSEMQSDDLILSLELRTINSRFLDFSPRLPRELIPYEDEEAVDFLVKDWTSLTRMDLDPIEDKTDVDTRKKARKFFNHPKDSLMATIYALKAQALKQYWNYVKTG